VLFVRAALENLPPELEGLAARVSVLFPWGTLLKAVAAPEPERLRAFRALCREGAELHLVFGYDATRERRAVEALRLAEATEERVLGELVPAYAAAGWEVLARRLDDEALESIPTTWAKRLRFGQARSYWELRGCAKEWVPSSSSPPRP
jgi:16S rRNA (adenine(1408)-N(1))-methyltransferase